MLELYWYNGLTAIVVCDPIDLWLWALEYSNNRSESGNGLLASIDDEILSFSNLIVIVSNEISLGNYAEQIANEPIKPQLSQQLNVNESLKWIPLDPSVVTAVISNKQNILSECHDAVSEESALQFVNTIIGIQKDLRNHWVLALAKWSDDSSAPRIWSKQLKSRVLTFLKCSKFLAFSGNQFLGAGWLQKCCIGIRVGTSLECDVKFEHGSLKWIPLKANLNG